VNKPYVTRYEGSRVISSLEQRSFRGSVLEGIVWDALRHEASAALMERLGDGSPYEVRMTRSYEPWEADPPADRTVLGTKLTLRLDVRRLDGP
jgi:hypothetical protein